MISISIHHHHYLINDNNRSRSEKVNEAMAMITPSPTPSTSTSGSTTPISTLPLELLQHLLSTLPNIPTLRSTFLTSRHIYRAFLSAESLITPLVLQHQLSSDNSDIFAEAIAAWNSSSSSSSSPKQQPPWTMARVDKFIAEYFSARTPTPALPWRSWKMVEAVQVSRLHGVEGFTAEFAAEMLNPASEFV